MADITSSLRQMRGPFLSDPEVYNTPQLTAEENAASLPGQLAKGVVSGLTGIGAGQAASQAFAAEQAGASNVSALRARAGDLARLSEAQAPDVRSFRDIHGVGDAADYFAGGIGGMIPYIPPVVAGAAAARVIGPSALRAFTPTAGSIAAMYPLEKGAAYLSQYQDPVQAAQPIDVRESAATKQAALKAALLGGGASSVLRGLAGRAGEGIIGGALEAGLPMVGAEKVAQHYASQLNPGRDTTHDTDALIDAAIQGGALGAAGHLPSKFGSAVGSAVDRFRPEPKPPVAPNEVGPPSEPLVPGGLVDGVKNAAGAINERVIQPGIKAAEEAYQGLKPKAADFAKDAEQFASEKVDKFAEATRTAESFPDFMRKVFGKEDEDAQTLVDGDKADAYKGADGKVDENKLFASDGPRKQKAAEYAQQLMDDPATPNHVKQKIASFNGDFSDPAAQSYVGNTILGQRAGQRAADVVNAIKKSVDDLVKKAQEAAPEIKKAAGEAIDGAKDAIIKKNMQEPKTKLEVESLIHKGLHDELQAQPAAIAQVPELAKIITKLLAQGAPIDDSALKVFGGFHAMDQLFKDTGATLKSVAETLGTDDLFKRSVKFRSAEEDSKRPDSMLYRAIPPEHREQMKGSNFRELGRFIDSVSGLDDKKFTLAVDGLATHVFGSKEAARTVVDYYTRKNESELADTPRSKDVEHPIDLANKGIVDTNPVHSFLYASVDPGKNQPFHTSEVGRKGGLDEQLKIEHDRGLAEVSKRNMADHVQREGIDPVDELARIEHMINKRIEGHEKHPQQDEKRKQDIANLKAQLEQIEERKREVTDDEMFKDNPDHAKEMAAENALKDFHVGVLTKADADKFAADDHFMWSASRAYMRQKPAQRKANRDKTVTFNMKDGKQMTLYAPAMVKLMGVKQGLGPEEHLGPRSARLFRDAITSMLLSDKVDGLAHDIHNVRYSDTATLASEAKEQQRVTKKVMEANKRFQDATDEMDANNLRKKELVGIIQEEKWSTHPKVYEELRALQERYDELKDLRDKARQDGADIKLDKTDKQEREEQGVTDIVKDIVEKEGNTRINQERGYRRAGDNRATSSGQITDQTAHDIKKQIFDLRKSLEDPGRPMDKKRIRDKIASLQQELRRFEKVKPEADVGERPEMTTGKAQHQAPVDDPLSKKKRAEIPGEIIRKKSRMSTQIHEDLGKEGIAATHDSPFKFDKFGWTQHKYKGEGIMVFGAGTYLSTGDGVHRSYKKRFTQMVEGRLDQHAHERNMAEMRVENYEGELRDLEPVKNVSKWQDYADWQNENGIADDYAHGKQFVYAVEDDFGRERFLSVRKMGDKWVDDQEHQAYLNAPEDYPVPTARYDTKEEAMRAVYKNQVESVKKQLEKAKSELAAIPKSPLAELKQAKANLEIDKDRYELLLRGSKFENWESSGKVRGVETFTPKNALPIFDLDGFSMDRIYKDPNDGMWRSEMYPGALEDNSIDLNDKGYKTAQELLDHEYGAKVPEAKADYDASVAKLAEAESNVSPFITKSATYHVTVRARPDEILKWDALLSKQPVAKGIFERAGIGKPDTATWGGDVKHGGFETFGHNAEFQIMVRESATGKWIMRVLHTKTNIKVHEALFNTRGEARIAGEKEFTAYNHDSNIGMLYGSDAYKKLANKLGGSEAASIYLAEHGLVGHEYASSGGKDDKFPNYVIYNDDRIDINHVHFSAQRPEIGKDISPEQAKSIRDYIMKTRGPEVRAELDKFAKDIGGSGEYYKNGEERVIKIARDALNPESVAFHESMHDFFNTLLNDTSAGKKVQEQLLRAADRPWIQAQLRVLLKDHPEALKQVKSEPEEALTYMYQFWAAGQLRMNMDAIPVFSRITKFIRDILGVVTRGEQAEAILQAFHDGKLKDMSVAGSVIADMNLKTIGDKFDAVAKPLKSVVGTWLTPTTDVLRNTGSPALKALADKFHMEPDRERGEPGFIQKRGQTEGKFDNKFQDALEGTTAAERKAALDELQSMLPPTTQLGMKLQKLLGDLFNYMDKAGVKNSVMENKKVVWKPLNRVNNYFPRVWDRSIIRAKEAEFRDLLKTEGNLTDTEANAIIKTITAGDGLVEWAENEHHMGFTPYSSAVKNRGLTFINQQNAAKFAAFQSKDMVNVLQTYIRQAVHRGEYARYFGNDGEGIKQALAQAKLEGASEKEILDAARAVRAMEGTLGAEINPRLRDVFNAAVGYENIVLLPFALFSSLIDPLGVAVRSGNVADAAIAFKDGVKGIFEDAFRVKKDREYEMARTIGVISDLNKLEAMGQITQSQYSAGWLRKANDLYFKLNGMETWNERMRVSAMGAGMRFMVRNKDNARYMEELGLEKGDVRELPDGRIARTTDEGLTPEQEQRVQAALYRFVDGAILRPNAAHRPAWTSDPHYMLVAHLKQYTFTFQQTILKQVKKEAQNGNYRPAFILASYVPFIAASDLMRGSIAGTIKNGWTFGEFMQDGIARSGILGVGSFGTDALKDAQLGQMPGSSFLGPTAQHIIMAAKTVAGAPGSSWHELLLRSMPASPLSRAIE